MKKMFYLIPLLLLTPMVVNAENNVNASFNNETCTLTISGTQTGHDATVSLFDDHDKKIGFKTGEINANTHDFNVDFVFTYDHEVTIKAVVSNETGGNEITKDNIVIPVCELANNHQGNEPVKDTTYTVTTENGDTITFKEEAGHTFRLNIMDFYGLSDVALTDLNIPKELYQMMLTGIANAVNDEGTLVAFLQIEIFDENDFSIKEGPFNIKIKMTEEMKKFNSFKIIYVDTDNNFRTQTPIELKVNGDYLEGTLEHLSTYAVVGNVVEETTPASDTTTGTSNPKTGDNLMFYIAVLGFSALGIVGTAVFLKKNQVNK